MKGSEILMDGSIPHGTREGHAAGCKGSHCPGKDGPLGQSCHQASIRYASDYSYRRRIDGGLSPEAIAAEDRLERESAPVKVPRGAVAATSGNFYEAPVSTMESSREPLPEVEPAAWEAELMAIPVDVGRHGTRHGYYDGCRLRDECPGVAVTGVSCANAANAYQKQRAADKKAGIATPAEVAVPPTVEEIHDGIVQSIDLGLFDGEQVPVEFPSLPHTGTSVRADDILTDLADSKEALANAEVKVVGLEQIIVEYQAELRRLDREIASLHEKRVQDALTLDVEKSQGHDLALQALQLGSSSVRLDLFFERGVLAHATVATGS